MNLGARILAISAIAVSGLAVGACPVLGQPGGANPGRGPNVAKPGRGPAEQALERAFQNVERLPPGLQNDVLALQDSLEEIREAWESNYAPDVEAEAEEVLQARERFEVDLADRIEQSRELRKKVVAGLRRDLRSQAEEFEWAPEIHEQTEAYEQIKEELDAAWRAKRSELGPAAKTKEIREAKSQFIEEHANLIAQQNALAAEIRALKGGGRGNGRGGQSFRERGQMPEALTNLRAELHAARNALREQKRLAREELKALSPQEREARRQEILQEFRDAHDEIKESRRRLIEDLRDETDGDRRTED